MRKRRRARELALRGLYAWEISGNRLDDVLEELFSEGRDDPEIVKFTSDLLRRTVAHKETLDRDVASVVENWEFERIALIDRLILRLALCELLHFQEIPPKVSINEAIDMAKKYSTEESGGFVNGILDSLYKHLKAGNRLVKTGRGLVEWGKGDDSGGKMNDIQVEHNPNEARLKELDVLNWPVWTKEVSEFPWKYDVREVCYFLEGEVLVTPDAGEPVRMGKGDLVTFPAELSCGWKILKDVKKHYRLG